MPYTLRGKIAQAHPYQLDKTLTVPGAGAEAESTGKAIAEAKKIAEDHISLTDNPHKVTKAQVGLGNVDNTPDAEKPVSTLQAEAIADAKKAGTDAQVTADNALEAAENAQTTADEAKSAAQNAEKNAKDHADSLHKFFDATIPASGWSENAPYTQTISVPGVMENDRPHIFPVYDEDEEKANNQIYAWSLVTKGTSGEDEITFYCIKKKPDTDIPIQIEVNR